MESRPEERGNLCRCSCLCWGLLWSSSSSPALWGCEAQPAGTSTSASAQPLQWQQASCTGSAAHPGAGSRLGNTMGREVTVQPTCFTRWWMSGWGLKLSSEKHRGARGSPGLNWSSWSWNPLSCLFPGPSEGKCLQARPWVTSWAWWPTETQADGMLKTVWEVHKSCSGIFRARTKRGEREGSWWFGGTSMGGEGRGQLWAKMLLLLAQCSVWLCLPLMALSALPENSFQFFLNINKMLKTIYVILVGKLGMNLSKT